MSPYSSNTNHCFIAPSSYPSLLYTKAGLIYPCLHYEMAPGTSHTHAWVATKATHRLNVIALLNAHFLIQGSHFLTIHLPDPVIRGIIQNVSKQDTHLLPDVIMMLVCVCQIMVFGPPLSVKLAPYVQFVIGSYIVVMIGDFYVWNECASLTWRITGVLGRLKPTRVRWQP
jgi:hypothetical protein